MTDQSTLGLILSFFKNDVVFQKKIKNKITLS
jgi:hypothetical protein